ncbi:PI-PLC X domain-containing protein At5g67130-like isoform X2 [Hibiscus syriacus]|uniref:PI-PLC X domain-containing protein At5g67130-like isoform X2 n=1 Tax=Hibiscus syriacus TaxID=106335 RepID=UPI0019237D29|nr:PI-PLC X domain-containing protein At5g67130-like isoform X2 [Hibiscus syriacus]
MNLFQNLDLVTAISVFLSIASACSNGQCKLLDECSSDGDCEAGLYCFACPQGFSGSRCVRSTITNQLQLLNNSLPFNKYAFLTIHNAYAIDGYPLHTPIPRVTFTNQEDMITPQLNRSEGGGSFQAVDTLNGKLLCGCDDIHACVPGSTSGACTP